MAEDLFADDRDLRSFVYETLCDHERLEQGFFEMTERPLRRGDARWGTLFRLDGPRQVRASAIWVLGTQKVMFYGSTGRRFQQADVRFERSGDDSNVQGPLDRKPTE